MLTPYDCSRANCRSLADSSDAKPTVATELHVRPDRWLAFARHGRSTWRWADEGIIHGWTDDYQTCLS